MTAKTASKPSTRPNTRTDPLTPVLALPVASGGILEGPGQLPLFDAAPDPAGSYWLAFTADRRFDVTEPTGRPESDANAPTHTNTHADAETLHSARQAAPCGEVLPC